MTGDGLTGTSGVLDVSELTQFFAHDKSSSITQLIKDKSRSPKITQIS